MPPDEPSPDQYGPILSTAQVATLLGLNPQTVQQMAKDGRLPAHRLPGARKYLFFQEDVVTFLRQHAVAVSEEQEEAIVGSEADGAQ
jgi:excisionase family DNA binding protein